MCARAHASEPVCMYLTARWCVNPHLAILLWQSKDGSQICGANGQPSGIRLRLAYAGETAAAASVEDAVQLPAGWEKKKDRECSYKSVGVVGGCGFVCS